MFIQSVSLVYRMGQKGDTVLVFEFPVLLDELYFTIFVYSCILLIE